MSGKEQLTTCAHSLAKNGTTSYVKKTQYL